MAVYARTRIRAGSSPYFSGKMDISYGYVQQPIDRRIVLPYERIVGRCYGTNGPDSVPSSVSYHEARGIFPRGAAALDEAYRGAYDRLVNEVKSKQEANFALTLLESRESIAMITRRFLGLTKGLQELRRGNLSGAARAFGVHDSREFKSKKPEMQRVMRQAGSDISGAFLEMKFGWIPMIQDITQSVEVLQRDFPRFRCYGQGRGFYRYENSIDEGRYSYITGCTGRTRVRLMASVQITNPNLYLANSLGFVNLPSLAWQAVPFSFVVDWFVPIGSFLESFTGFLGADLTMKQQAARSDANGFEENRDNWFPDSSTSRTSDCTYFRRSQLELLPVPSFSSRNTGPSLDVGKAVTGFFLLMQAFTGR